MSGFVTPNSPNLTDFLTFLNTSVQIPTTALPTDSPWPGYAFNQIMEMINRPSTSPGVLYSLAAYNGATHLLISITPDQPGQSYFTSLRSGESGGFGMNAPQLGLITASADESTSNSYATPDALKQLTIGQLDFYRSPYGRQFLNWQQAYGPSIWGLT